MDELGVGDCLLRLAELAARQRHGYDALLYLETHFPRSAGGLNHAAALLAPPSTEIRCLFAAYAQIPEPSVFYGVPWTHAVSRRAIAAQTGAARQALLRLGDWEVPRQ